MYTFHQSYDFLIHDLRSACPIYSIQLGVPERENIVSFHLNLIYTERERERQREMGIDSSHSHRRLPSLTCNIGAPEGCHPINESFHDQNIQL